MHPVHMALDERIAEERLSPQARRAHLRAFADRMLLRAAAMDDPEDMDGLERAVRAAAVIERIYSRCDRAETHTPDPRKLEAERARHADEAIKARVSLAGTLKWAEARRADLGSWWEAAQAEAIAAPVPVRKAPEAKAPETKAHETKAATAQASTTRTAAAFTPERDDSLKRYSASETQPGATLPGLTPVTPAATGLRTLAGLRQPPPSAFGTLAKKHSPPPP